MNRNHRIPPLAFVFAIVGIIAMFVGWYKIHSPSTPTTSTSSTQPALAQTTQPVVDTSYPDECNSMHFSLLNLYSSADYHSMVWDAFSTGAQGKAWLAVLGNGNFEILSGKLLTDKNGSHYCMVQIHLSGTYMGSSYDGTYWAMAI